MKTRKNIASYYDQTRKKVFWEDYMFWSQFTNLELELISKGDPEMLKKVRDLDKNDIVNRFWRVLTDEEQAMYQMGDAEKIADFISSELNLFKK